MSTIAGSERHESQGRAGGSLRGRAGAAGPGAERHPPPARRALNVQGGHGHSAWVLSSPTIPTRPWS